MHAIRLATGLLISTTGWAQLPPVQAPQENPVTAEKVLLGKILFWEEQLSSDDTMACGTCHMPEAGGGDPRSATAAHPGFDGLTGTRDDVHASPGMVRQDAQADFGLHPTFGLRPQVTGRVANSTHGAAYHAELFWDGRAGSTFVDPETNTVAIHYGGALESQALGPILSATEMSHEGRTWDDVRNKLTAAQPMRLATSLTPDIAAALQLYPDYPALFAMAFGDPAINARRIAFAIASYERTLIPNQTPYDAFLNGDGSALTPTELHGLQVFESNGRCSACHPAPFFSDDLWHNLGLRPAVEDEGRKNISGVSIDSATFKTPSLRNVGLRPRLFHNGSSPAIGSPDQLTDPDSVLNVYLNGGGVDRTNLDPFLLPLQQLGVTAQDLLDVMAFLDRGLTDPRAAQGLPPFDHPTLFSTSAPAPTRFGAGYVGASEPTIIDVVPAWVGNRSWKLGLAGGDGDTLAYLAWSQTQQMNGPMLGNAQLHVGPAFDGQFLLLQNAPGSPGLQTFRLEIPQLPALHNVSVFLQLLVADPAAPQGIAASQGHHLTLQ
jgi:cytochrome c peroxidase